MSLQKAADAINCADSILICAGAGMGVDSGLPDFRGNEGFWKAYPPFQKAGFSFMDLAQPHWFATDPELAWGFYGHRLHLYRDTQPHAGFDILLKWANQKPGGAFILTSNVDGQFQKAGFSRSEVWECHGSIHHLQCSRPCCQTVWDAADLSVQVNPDTFRAASPLPQCPKCGVVARPNVLMFGDHAWLSSRSDMQQENLEGWANGEQNGSLVVVECGAGKSIPTVRNFAEHIAKSTGGTLIRINPRDTDVPHFGISVESGSLEALQRIDEILF